MNFKSFCWQIFKPYKFYMVGILLTSLLSGLYMSLSPYLLKIVIDSLAQSKPVSEVYWAAIPITLQDAKIGECRV